MLPPLSSQWQCDDSAVCPQLLKLASRGGIEPPLIDWKSIVLTTRRTRHLKLLFYYINFPFEIGRSREYRTHFITAYETVQDLTFREQLKLVTPPRFELGLEESKPSVLTVTLKSHLKFTHAFSCPHKLASIKISCLSIFWPANFIPKPTKQKVCNFF